MLGKSKKFDSAWSLVLDRIGGDEKPPAFVSGDTFAIMIRRYARAGIYIIQYAIEFASNLTMKFGFADFSNWKNWKFWNFIVIRMGTSGFSFFKASVGDI